MTRKSAKSTFPQIAALRERAHAHRRQAAKPSCPNPRQALQIAALLLEIADMIEAIILANRSRAAFAH
jgi:hypothetical protein